MNTLVAACQADNVELAYELMASGVDVNAPQSDGSTALHWAVYHDETQLAVALLQAGANARDTNRYGIAALNLACQHGNATLVQALLDAGAQPERALKGGETPLMIAARTGSLAIVDQLLSRNADVNAAERRGQTALMWAAAEGHIAVVDRLLQAGADWTTELESGFNALFFAVRQGQAEVVLRLLTAGADVNSTMQPKRGGGGKGPSKGMSPLLLAVENGHFELAAALLRSGADPNDQRSGFTALHALTWVRKPNRGDGTDGDPSPTGSGQLDSLSFARELVALGADVNARLSRGDAGRGKLNRKGMTPLLMAADTADIPLLRLLLELGADATINNVDDCTPLLAAAGIGTLAPGEEAGTEDEAIAAVTLFLDLGADINHVDANGETAMHGAAYKSLPRMVQVLADRGADPKTWNRKNKFGWTPVSIAEGYRPGNFKPSVETLDALRNVLMP